MSTPFLTFSLKRDGHMGVLGAKNREKFFKKNGIDPKKVIDAIPSHGNKIKTASVKNGGKYFESIDGLITREKGIYLALTAADCMPIAFYNSDNNSIGLLHCGWRGLENGSIPKMVTKMAKGKLLAYIGPHICKKHYVRDLSEEARLQLLKAGVKEKNITIDSRCTFESKDLFSYRRGSLKDRNLYLLTLNNG